MKIHAVCQNYIVFSSTENEIMNETETKDFVRKQLQEKLIPSWNNISIEVFTGSGEALYLAHPIDSLKISIAPFLLPYMRDYFTE